MNIENINPGQFYLIKPKCTIFESRGVIAKVSARDNDKEYPFEITAARLGVKPEEIFAIK